MIRLFTEMARLEFTLSHLVRLYRPFHHRGLLTLWCRSSMPFVVDDKEDGDRDWARLFVRVWMVDIITVEHMPFIEGWNYAREWSA